MKKVKWLYEADTGSGDEIELVMLEMYQPPRTIRTQAGEYLETIVFELDEDSMEEIDE